MTRTAAARALLVVTLAAAAAGAGCSSGSAHPTDGAAGSMGAAGAGGQQATLFGNVTVELIKDEYTGFLALFFDGPPPAMMPLETRQTLGDCKLMVPRAVRCEAGCAAGTVCTGADECTPRPAPVDVGVLHVEGLGATALDLQPTSPTVLSYQVVPTLPYPACSEGGDVGVRAELFTLAGKCTTALTVTSPVPIPVVSGQATHLTWTPPGRAGISRVQVELEISHHGGFKGQLECDVADTGAFDIPAPLVTALVELGRAGYPTVKVARAAIAAAPAHPQVKLVVSSRVEVDVDTGVISCGADASSPCPPGTACQSNFTCR